jgi:flagellar assembly protein FliH
MGKVIKRSAESGERYTVAIPSSLAAPAAETDASYALEGEPDAVALAGPVEPEIDFEAIAAQARAVIAAAEHEARALTSDAERRARDVVDEAIERSRAQADEARRQGRDDGYAGGVDAAQAAMAGMLDAMRELLEATRAERHALLTSAEPELVRLAVGIAERVLHQQIALDTGVVVEMARAAILRIVDRERITVRVNPADIERMREHRDELLALGDVKTMRVIEDQRVDRGGVIVETDAGSIDAKISTQLAEVRKILHIVDDLVVQSPDRSAVADDDATPLTAARAS